MGVRLLGLTLSGIDRSPPNAHSGARAAPFVGVQQTLPLGFVE
jgi:hypothetical protein